MLVSNRLQHFYILERVLCNNFVPGGNFCVILCRNQLIQQLPFLTIKSQFLSQSFQKQCDVLLSEIKNCKATRSMFHQHFTQVERLISRSQKMIAVISVESEHASLFPRDYSPPPSLSLFPSSSIPQCY